MTLDGSFVQAFPIENPGGDLDDARGMLPVGTRYLVAFNGTFSPHLSIRDLDAETWRHLALPGWSVTSTVPNGELARFGTSVFAPDQSTAYGVEAGVVHFDVSSGTASRFADGHEVTGLARRGRELYVMSPAGSASGRRIDVFEVETLEHLDQIDLVPALGFLGQRTALAVDADGTLLLSDFEGGIHRVDRKGVLLDTATFPCEITITCRFTDLQVASDGTVFAATDHNQILVIGPDLLESYRIDLPVADLHGRIHLAVIPERRACDDWVDNDGDGLTDLDDPQCADPSGGRERARRACGLGAELALLLPALVAARRGGRRAAGGRRGECRSGRSTPRRPAVPGAARSS